MRVPWKWLLPTLAAMIVVPSAVSAQNFSAGYEFLKAVRDRDGDIVSDTLDQPGNTVVNTRDLTSGETALHIVTQRRDLQWIRFLTGKGANPNLADKKGTTPLQIASNLGFLDGIEALVKAGARVDVANSAGETPLISAVHRRDLATIRFLMKNGARADRADNSGRTARDYAELMSASGPLIEALDNAAGENRANGAGYGPGIG